MADSQPAYARIRRQKNSSFPKAGKAGISFRSMVHMYVCEHGYGNPWLTLGIPHSLSTLFNSAWSLDSGACQSLIT